MRTFRFFSSELSTEAGQPVPLSQEPRAPEEHDGYKWTALSVTTVGALLAAIQGSALLIALPNIMAELHASFLTIMWVLLGYLLITTVMTPIIGRLADMWGRKSLYNSGFLLFGLGSLACGLAQPQFHGSDMIVGRVIQGLGGALMITNSTAIVTDAFKKGQVGLGLGVNQIAGAAGFLIGPVLGGLLTQFSWRWVFLFNVPLAIFGSLWGIWRLRESVRLEAHQHIDWFGAITLTLGLTGILLGLSMLAFPLIPLPAIYAMLIVGAISLLVFLVFEPRVREPLLQLRLFRRPGEGRSPVARSG